MVNLLKKQTDITFRTSDDLDIKLGPVTKINKSTKKPSKQFDDDVMPAKVTSSSFF